MLNGWATSTILIPRTGKYYVEFTAGTMVSNTFYGMYDTSDWSPWTFNGFDNNQGGFYGWSGGHNTYQWCAAPNQTVNTVAFYVK